jgi:hypothetical protein
MTKKDKVPSISGSVKSQGRDLKHEKPKYQIVPKNEPKQFGYDHGMKNHPKLTKPKVVKHI